MPTQWSHGHQGCGHELASGSLTLASSSMSRPLPQRQASGVGQCPWAHAPPLRSYPSYGAFSACPSYIHTHAYRDSRTESTTGRGRYSCAALQEDSSSFSHTRPSRVRRQPSDSSRKAVCTDAGAPPLSLIIASKSKVTHSHPNAWIPESMSPEHEPDNPSGHRTLNSFGNEFRTREQSCSDADDGGILVPQDLRELGGNKAYGRHAHSSYIPSLCNGSRPQDVLTSAVSPSPTATNHSVNYSHARNASYPGEPHYGAREEKDDKWNRWRLGWDTKAAAWLLSSADIPTLCTAVETIQIQSDLDALCASVAVNRLASLCMPATCAPFGSIASTSTATSTSPNLSSRTRASSKPSSAHGHGPASVHSFLSYAAISSPESVEVQVGQGYKILSPSQQRTYRQLLLQLRSALQQYVEDHQFRAALQGQVQLGGADTSSKHTVRGDQERTLGEARPPCLSPYLLATLSQSLARMGKVDHAAVSAMVAATLVEQTWTERPCSSPSSPPSSSQRPRDRKSAKPASQSASPRPSLFHFTKQELANFAWGLASMNHPVGPHWLDLLYRVSEPRLPAMTASQLVTLTWALARLSRKGHAQQPQETGGHCSPQAQVAHHWQAGSQLKVPIHAPAPSLSQQQQQQQQQDHRRSYHPQQQQSRQQGVQLLPFPPASWWAALEAAATPELLANARSSQISALLWAVGRLSPSPRPSGEWMQVVVMALDAHLCAGALPAVEATMVMDSLTLLKFRPPPHWAAYFLDSYGRAASHNHDQQQQKLQQTTGKHSSPVHTALGTTQAPFEDSQKGAVRAAAERESESSSSGRRSSTGSTGSSTTNTSYFDSRSYATHRSAVRSPQQVLNRPASRAAGSPPAASPDLKKGQEEQGGPRPQEGGAAGSSRSTTPASQLQRILRGSSNLACSVPLSVLESTVTSMQSRLSHMCTRELVEAAEALQKLGYTRPSKAFLQLWLEECYDVKAKLKPKESVRVLKVLAAWGVDPGAPWMTGFLACVSASFPRFSRPVLVDLLVAIAALGTQLSPSASSHSVADAKQALGHDSRGTQRTYLPPEENEASSKQLLQEAISLTGVFADSRAVEHSHKAAEDAGGCSGLKTVPAAKWLITYFQCFFTRKHKEPKAADILRLVSSLARLCPPTSHWDEEPRQLLQKLLEQYLPKAEEVLTAQQAEQLRHSLHALQASGSDGIRKTATHPAGSSGC